MLMSGWRGNFVPREGGDAALVYPREQRSAVSLP